MKRKKFMAVLLTVCMGLSVCLTGCGGKESSSTGTAVDKEHMYKAEYLTPKHKLSYINDVFAANGFVYVRGYLEQPDGSINGEVFVKLDPETGEETIYSPPTDENGSIFAVSESIDGNIIYLEEIYNWNEENTEENKQRFFFKAITPEMEEVSSIELSDMEEMYPEYLTTDKEGNIYVGNQMMLRVYSADGEKLYEEAANSVSTLVTDTEGNVFFADYTDDYGKEQIKRVDVNEKQLEEQPDTGLGIGYTLLRGNASYPLYLNDRKNLYGFQPQTGEKTLLFNWVNSDINGSNIGNCSVLPDGRVVTSAYNDFKGRQEVVILTKVDPADVKDKEILTMAGVYDDYSIKNAVIAFNRESEEYRIVLKDYSEYATSENYSGDAEQFNNDLISGNIPDIINLNGLNVNNYISKGLLEDLYPWMDKDESFNRSDYLENIFKACEKDGKLYELVPYFSACTVIGKTSNVGEEPGWTMEDLEEAYKKLPEGAKIFSDVSRETILHYAHLVAGEQFVNYKTGECNYDDGEFAKLLAFVKQFPTTEELYSDKYGTDTGEIAVDAEDSSQGYRSNKILLQLSYVYGYDDVHQMRYDTYGGEEITFIGFPTADKNGSAINPEMEFAMSAKSANKEGVWQFLKFFLSDEYQETIGWGWPIKKSQLERLQEKAQEPEYYIDENGEKVEVENISYIDGKEVNIGKISDADVEKINEFLGSLNQIVRYDEKITNIITEESESYFSGQKSADEVCKIIQNKVHIYLSETR